jgi:hypothetical protein
MKSNIKEALLSFGYPLEDIKIISGTRIRTTDHNDKPISHIKAIERLGVKEFASGLGRSTFHFSCGRGEGESYVSFTNKTWADEMGR